jgi:hypothetical protein
MGARSAPLYGRYIRPTTFFLDGEESEFLFQRDIAPFLRALGYSYSTSEINRLCSPTVDQGPPIARWYGPRPLRRPTDVIGWAAERLQAKMRRIFNGKPRVRRPRRGPSGRHPNAEFSPCAWLSTGDLVTCARSVRSTSQRGRARPRFNNPQAPVGQPQQS